MNIPTKLVCLTIFSLLLLTACSTNRLHEYTLENTTAAAEMSPAPRAQVFSHTFFAPSGNIVSALIEAGTNIAKEVEAQKAQRKLDSAMVQVDIPEIIRYRTLQKCSRHLEMRPVEKREQADFVYVMRIKKYGIEAESWTAQVQFLIDVNVRMIDNEKELKIWERNIHERMDITGSIFGFSERLGDVITAAALSKLTEEQMVEGFANLAEYAAGRVAERIYDDFLESRERLEEQTQ